MANTYISRTHSGTATNTKKITYSAWLKFGTANATEAILVEWLDGNHRVEFLRLSTGEIRLEWVDGGSNSAYFKTVRKFRDVNGWFHFVFTLDTTLATAGDRIKLYINGVRETEFDSSYGTMNPALNKACRMNENGKTVYMGQRGNSAQYWTGSMSHIHFVDGTAYQADTFGSTDSTTGEWKINTSPTVTYGNHGWFILKDGNSVTDQSGNGNNCTASGTLTKTEDNPSNIFCTLNPLMICNGYASGNATSLSFSNGNTYAGKVTHGAYFGTIGVSSGKFYWEVKVEDTNQLIGIVAMRPTGGVTYLYDDATINGYYPYGNNVYTNGSSASGGPYDNTSNKIYSFALDAGNNKLWVGRDGSFTGDPANGTGATWSSLPTGHDWTPFMHSMSTSQNNNAWFNFGNGYFGTTAVSSAGTNASGNGIFEYDVPTGYTALSTKGLNL